MFLGQRLNARQVIATPNPDRYKDKEWALVLLFDQIEADAGGFPYHVMWVKRGTDDDGVIGWKIKPISRSRDLKIAAESYDSHIMDPEPA